MSAGVSKSEGFGKLARHYENGNPEVKHLLDRECAVLYECKYCRDIFRSLILFISHKRSTCRSMFGDLSEELELAKKFQAEMRKKRDDRGEAVGPARPGRTNLEAVIEERSQRHTVTLPHSKKQLEVSTLPKTQRAAPLTEFEGGFQRLLELPTGEAIAAQLPDSRVVVVMPQENSSRYGEMQLRNRRVDEKAATLTAEQLKVLQKLPDEITNSFELASLDCSHVSCKQIRPFDSFEALVYHMTLTHPADGDEGAYRCYFCDLEPFASFDKLKAHLKEEHHEIRQNHLDARRSSQRRTYRRKNERDHRSISPVGVAEEDEENEEKGSGSEGEQEPKEEDTNDSSAMPTLRKMPVRRGKRQKGRKAVPKPTLSPQKVRAAAALEETEAKKEGEFDYPDVDHLLNIRSNNTALSTPAKEPKELLETKRETPGKRRSTRGVSKQSVGSISDEIEEKEVKEEERDGSTTGEESEEEAPAKKRRKRADVSLISGREPRQRAINSRLAKDFVVPKKFAAVKQMGDPSLLSEPQYRQLAKQQAKEQKLKQQEKRRGAKADEKAGTSDGKTSVGLARKRKGGVQKKGAKKNATSQSRGSSPSNDDEMHEVAKSVIDKVRQSLLTDATMSSESSPESSREVTPQVRKKPPVAPPPKHKKKPKKAAKPKVLSIFDDPEREPTPESAKTPFVDMTPMRSEFPSVLTGEDRETISTTPAKKGEIVPPVTDETRGEAASRRKQNFNGDQREDDPTGDLKLVQMPGQQPRKPDDLTQLPVTLSTNQRRAFFGPLKALSKSANDKNTLHQCAECGALCKTQSEGHKHMMGHIRMIRLKCSLCDAGAFFCTDMRRHLMYRHCENIHVAPPEMLQRGSPCMDVLTADKLTRLADPNEPGKACYDRGKIISNDHPTPYYPDPRIENKLLNMLKSGAPPPLPRGSPRKIVLTANRKTTPNPPAGSSSQRSATSEPPATPTADSLLSSQPAELNPPSNASSKDSTPPATTNAALGETDANSELGAAAAVQPTEKPPVAAEKKPTTDFVVPSTIRVQPPAPPKPKSPEPEPPQPAVPAVSPAEPPLADSLEQETSTKIRTGGKPSILSARSSIKSAPSSQSSADSQPTAPPAAPNTPNDSPAASQEPNGSNAPPPVEAVASAVDRS